MGCSCKEVHTSQGLSTEQPALLYTSGSVSKPIQKDRLSTRYNFISPRLKLNESFSKLLHFNWSPLVSPVTRQIPLHCLYRQDVAMFYNFCGIFGIRELLIRICVWIWFLFQAEVSFRLLALPSIHLTVQQFMILIYCALICRLNDFPDSLSHWQKYQLQVWPQVSF